MMTIKGKPKPAYNDFEQYVSDMIGSVGDKFGLAYYFYELDSVFKTSEDCLKKVAVAYNASLIGEDPEVLRSLKFNDPDHDIKSTPDLKTLWTSYFITVHSEFESNWQETYEAFNNFSSATIKYGKIADTYFNTKIPTAYTRLDTLVSTHQLLFRYNFIRNKVVHGNADITSTEFINTQATINNGQINHVKFEIDGSRARFVITDIKFIQEYANAILSFFEAILPV